MHLTLSTWLVGDETGQETAFPQNAGLSSTWSFQETYWRCLAVYFFSAQTFHPDARRVLFLNTPPRPEAANYVRELEKLGVQIVLQPFSTRPPQGFTQSFGNQFYLFDVLEHIAASPEKSAWYVLDSDCLLTRPFDLAGAVEREPSGILTYDIGYPSEKSVNGVSRRQLGEIARQEGWKHLPSEDSPYCGGEFFAARSDVLAEQISHFRAVRERCVARWRENQATVKEEAHVLSLVYELLGVPIGTANSLVKRMWTTFKHSNIAPEDTHLPIWHLPSEKKTGIRRLYDDINQKSHANRSVEWWQKRIALQCGIPRRAPRVFAQDVLFKVREKFARR